VLRFVYLAVILLVVVGICFVLISKKNSSSTPVVQTQITSITPVNRDNTEVILYKQTNIPSKTQKGSCWTRSIAAPSNDKAWRCTSGNSIFDPCFESDNGKVVCQISPEDLSSGFELQLTDKLPKDKEPFNANFLNLAWMVKLTNGIYCYAMTGTAGEIDGVSFNYSCDQDAFVYNNFSEISGNMDETFDKRGNLWKTKVAYFSKSSLHITKTEDITVEKAWE
jgi:hypothetical protein